MKNKLLTACSGTVMLLLCNSCLAMNTYSLFTGAAYNYNAASLKSGIRELSDPQKVIARKDDGYTLKLGYRFDKTSYELGHAMLITKTKSTNEQVGNSLSETESNVKMSYAAFNYFLPSIAILTPKLSIGAGVISDEFYYLKEATKYMVENKNKICYIVGGSLQLKTIGALYVDMGIKSITGSSIYKTITNMEIGMTYYI